MLCLSRRPRIGDELAFVDVDASPHAQCAEVGERGLVLARVDGDGQPVGRYGAGKRHLARDGCTNSARLAQSDVDAAMLARGVRVGNHVELEKKGTVGGPGPRPGRRTADETPHGNES
jgi:hypothetical protein